MTTKPDTITEEQPPQHQPSLFDAVANSGRLLTNRAMLYDLDARNATSGLMIRHMQQMQGEVQ